MVLERPARVWKIRPRSLESEDRLMRDLGIPRLLAIVLSQRGIVDPEQAERFLNPQLEHLHSPHLLPDFEAAKREILAAKEAGQTIYVHGDYDVDGVTSAAIFTRFLQKIGCKVIPHVPHRMKEGYGIHMDAVQWAKEQGAHLFLTCDCGISAHDQLDAVHEAGMRAVVTDHHELKETLPNAAAVVNPHRRDSNYPFAMLSGAGVALKVCAGLVPEVDRQWESEKAVKSFYSHYMDLAAMGTIADIMPLVDENRIIAKFGLPCIQAAKRKGMQALLEVAERMNLPRPLAAHDVGFQLAPRVNAVGRIGDAADALQMLLTSDLEEARSIARQLDKLNRERRAEQEKMVEEAMLMIEESGVPERGVLLVARQGWHPGIIGLVASKLVERFHRPAFVVALGEDGKGKGSARSISGYHLAEALNSTSSLHLGGGGHELAAGFSVDGLTIDDLRTALTQRAMDTMTLEEFEPKLMIDAMVDPCDVDDQAVEALRSMEPFGQANFQPMFGAENVKFLSLRTGNNPDHAFPTLDCGNKGVPGVSWTLGSFFRGLEPGTPLNVAFRPEFNEFRGQKTLQWKVEDARPYLEA